MCVGNSQGRIVYLCKIRKIKLIAWDQANVPGQGFKTAKEHKNKVKYIADHLKNSTKFSSN